MLAEGLLAEVTCSRPSIPLSRKKAIEKDPEKGKPVATFTTKSMSTFSHASYVSSQYVS